MIENIIAVIVGVIGIAIILIVIFHQNRCPDCGGKLVDLTEREWGKDMSKMIHYKTQSAKAKEIINKLIELVDFLNEDNVKEPIIAEAEQFIKEVEK